MTTKTITIKEAAEKYIAHLGVLSKNARTIETYKRHLDLAIQYFGEAKDVAKILPVHVSAFFKSDPVNKMIREPKKEGEPLRERQRSIHTIRQTIRVYKQMLVFCKDQGWTDKVPLPKEFAAKIKESAAPEQSEAAKAVADQGE